jgi:MSHA biogenesis protein MshL
MLNKYLNLLLIISFSCLISSCELPKNEEIEAKKEDGYKSLPKREDSWFRNPRDRIDPYGDLNREDYSDLAKRDGSYFNSGKPVGPKIRMPDVTDLLSEPESQKIANDKLVSISVNENVPLKDVIIELARRAEVDVEIDKNIDGGIIFVAKDKPFSQVIDRIANMAGLNYSFDDGILKISKDTPVIKNYKFNILDLTRNSSSSVTTSFTVGSSAGGSSSSSDSSSSSGSAAGGAISGGSTASLNSQSGDGDIWTNITAGVTQILSMYISDDSSAAQPADGSAPATNANRSGIISVNKNAGMVTILATNRQHKAVKEYLDRIHIELTSQVLIEAKVVEVTLNDEYNSGINWNLFLNGGDVGIGGGFGATGVGATIADIGTDDGFIASALPFDLFGDNNTTLDGAIELLQTFGTTRSLSNPRISALNNQFAVLNFSKNEVYFLISESETTTTSSGGSTTSGGVETEVQTVPIGVVLAIQPSIDLQKKEILMNVRPTLTRVTDRISDPGADIIASNNGLDPDTFNSQIPVVDTRELDTTLRVKNGEIMVIGGLLEEASNNTDTGLPGASGLPFIGNAFKGVSKLTTNVETVIFIKATIVPGRGVSVEDEEFYKKFTTGRTKFFESE